MNHYKIDWSHYSANEYPYALYSRAAWWRRWQHIECFRTIDEAKALHVKLAGLPIALSN